MSRHFLERNVRCNSAPTVMSRYREGSKNFHGSMSHGVGWYVQDEL